MEESWARRRSGRERESATARPRRRARRRERERESMKSPSNNIFLVSTVKLKAANDREGTKDNRDAWN